MASEKKLLRHEYGVELWEVALRNDGFIVARAYNLKTLRTPESPGFNNLVEAEAAFYQELALSKASDLVARRLR